MLYKKIMILLVISGVGILLLAGCYKDKTVILAAPAITRTVSFAQDIIPIFTKSCSLSGCHTTGGQSPNLSASSAYNSLINGGDLINKSTPESSVLYMKLSGTLGNPMPPGGVNQDYSALVLAWIKQGANNN